MTLRVISGTLKSRKLFSVRSSNITRPTSDRLRETIFNIIGNHTYMADVLDIFAGTGSLGIEAISRGAEHAVFMEKNKTASLIIDKNIKLCMLEKKTTNIKRDVLLNLNFIKSIKISFDLVFMDPPYNMGFVKPVLQNLHDNCLIKEDGFIIVEHSCQEIIPQRIKELELFDQRKYGRSMISFYRKNMSN